MNDENKGGGTGAKRVASFARRVLPWAGSAVLLAFVGSRQDLSGLLDALRSAHYVPFLAITAVFLVVNLLLDSVFLTFGFQRLEGVGRYRDMVRARAAAYLLTIVSVVLGYGGLALWARRRYGVPLRRGIGLMLNELLHELGSVGLLVLIGSLLIPEISALAVGVGLGCVAFWTLCLVTSRVWQWLPDRFRWRSVFSVFVDMTLAQWLAFFGMKLVQNVVHGLFVALALVCFRISAPVLVGMTLTQVIHVLRGVPITAFGIGVDQVAFPLLFAPWETGLGGQA